MSGPSRLTRDLQLHPTLELGQYSITLWKSQYMQRLCASFTSKAGTGVRFFQGRHPFMEAPRNRHSSGIKRTTYSSQSCPPHTQDPHVQDRSRPTTLKVMQNASNTDSICCTIYQEFHLPYPTAISGQAFKYTNTR